MAMSLIMWLKSGSGRFADALRTYAIEAMMQDNKALQAGTSHNLGQNFAKVFDLKFQAEHGGQEFAWNTSWGVSTRLIGGLVMTHGDDNGTRCPPLLAPIEVVIVPIYKSDDERGHMLEAAHRVVSMLTDWERREPGRLRVHLDACEAQIKDETKATIRVLPDEEFRSAEPPTACLKCGRPSIAEAVWAKAY